MGSGSRIKTEGYGQSMNVMVNKRSETWWEEQLEHAGFTIDDRRTTDGHHTIHASGALTPDTACPVPGECPVRVCARAPHREEHRTSRRGARPTIATPPP
ncbi:hypothetical protein GCM10009762_15780 [Dermacoccus barathri]|uniref:Uncharacterized protein n=1 Tax=Dermacoccus barathri TaxID=322601 RepID=A0ABN2BPA7_9MICO